MLNLNVLVSPCLSKRPIAFTRPEFILGSLQMSVIITRMVPIRALISISFLACSFLEKTRPWTFPLVEKVRGYVVADGSITCRIGMYIVSRPDALDS